MVCPCTQKSGRFSAASSIGTMAEADGRSTFKAPMGSFSRRPPSDSGHPFGGVRFSHRETRDEFHPDAGIGNGLTISATRARSRRGELEPTLTRAYMAAARTPGSESSRADVSASAANEALGPIRPIRKAASERARASPVRSCRISR